ncbi:ABC transporter substrate-binding protein [Chelatococcus asaccharovorans]|uniref:Peptide/nickel transport system substrate-binding protein/oligopeptide transport system substrate-binding protein n=1 Tax=Chelatococcus asaccharovorans TaxID=28210 RepID=A0A2V3TZX8_9HYPH|nr:ABC transporter substrate-binding protein [Chelatococcus asaccharovorans]MBS7707698.1 ABC transporter substrate-binding protein [Chelatococcus asaccharovorans]PXW55274.1 peptide/nickel transport system substrate-binding protein/oligopeptide transport system substrate-binding protein [Chelatococcus asaccharovorans]
MNLFKTAGIGTTALSLLTYMAFATPVVCAELRTNLPADPATIDPIVASELIAGDVIRNIYESFTAIDSHGNVIPSLAESWEALDGGRGFRIHLRKGVKFHSGRVFTAKDVKFSLEQLLLPTSKAGLNSPHASAIVGADEVKSGATTELKGVKIVDDYTVEIALKSVNPLFPLYPIYMMDSGVIAEAGANWATKISAGTGPFKFGGWSRGQQVQLEAHKDYWRGAPKIDGVRFMIVPDSNTAMSMYETGGLDLLRVPADLVRRVIGDAAMKGQLVTSPEARVRYLAMNAELYKPFEDKRVREAFCISLDQAEMIEGLYYGAALPFYGAVPPGIGGYNSNLKPINVDPKRARALLAEAGYAGGAGMPPLNFSNLEPNKTESLYITSKIKEALGVNVGVEILERGTMLKSMNSRQLPYYYWGWSLDYPDGLNFLEALWYGPSPYNRGWKNAEYDARIAEAKAIADNDARYKVYNQAEKILLDEWGMCPLPLQLQVVLVKPGVKGVKLTSSRLEPFWDVSIKP